MLTSESLVTVAVMLIHPNDALVSKGSEVVRIMFVTSSPLETNSYAPISGAEPLYDERLTSSPSDQVMERLTVIVSAI